MSEEVLAEAYIPVWSFEKQVSLPKPDQAFLCCILKRKCGTEHSVNISVILRFSSLCSVGLIGFGTPGPKLIQFRVPVSAPTFVSQCLRKASYFGSKSCLHPWVFYITKSGWQKPVCRGQNMLSNKRLRQRQEFKRWCAWHSDSYLCNIHNIFPLS